MGLAEAGAAAGGWEAELQLGFEAREERTVLARRRHRGPLAVQKPFYPEGGVCHCYLLHPPGGLVGGDRLRIEVSVEGAAHALITTPAAAKVYRSAGPIATQTQRIRVASRGTLEWLPQETILYDHCRAQTETDFKLEPGARFIGWELCCLGRPAARERFEGGTYHQRFEIWRGDTPLLIERMRLDGGDALLQRPWGLGGRTVLGTLAAVPADKAMVETVRESVRSDRGGLYCATLLDEVLLCRYAGNHAEEARACFASVWSALRPALLGRAACPPRIWLS